MICVGYVTSLKSLLNIIDFQGMLRLLTPYVMSLIWFEFKTELFGKVDVTTDIVYSQNIQHSLPTEPESSTGNSY